MYTFPVRARTLKKLAQMSQPQTVEGGQSEALAWQIYDTVSYLDNATQSLTLFTTARANRFLSNLNGNGFPTPQYFEAYFWGLDILIPPAATAWEDMWGLLNGTGTGGTPVWSFTLANKEMGPFPLRGLSSLGGITGYGEAAAAPIQYANNGTLASTFASDGAVVIPPNQTFEINLRWPEPIDVAAEEVELQAWVAGVLHRRVL